MIADHWRSGPRARALLNLCRTSLAAVILITTLAPHDPMPSLVGGQDKLEHVIAFCLLAAAFCWGVTGRRFWFSGLSAVAVAVLIEVLQTLFVPTRVGSLADALAGGIGVATGMALAHIAERHRRVRG